jgi:hypothetical protein
MDSFFMQIYIDVYKVIWNNKSETQEFNHLRLSNRLCTR